MRIFIDRYMKKLLEIKKEERKTENLSRLSLENREGKFLIENFVIKNAYYKRVRFGKKEKENIRRIKVRTKEHFSTD